MLVCFTHRPSAYPETYKPRCPFWFGQKWMGSTHLPPSISPKGHLFPCLCLSRGGHTVDGQSSTPPKKPWEPICLLALYREIGAISGCRNPPLGPKRGLLLCSLVFGSPDLADQQVPQQADGAKEPVTVAFYRVRRTKLSCKSISTNHVFFSLGGEPVKIRGQGRNSPAASKLQARQRPAVPEPTSLGHASLHDAPHQDCGFPGSFTTEHTRLLLDSTKRSLFYHDQSHPRLVGLRETTNHFLPLAMTPRNIQTIYSETACATIPRLPLQPLRRGARPAPGAQPQLRAFGHRLRGASEALGVGAAAGPPKP